MKRLELQVPALAWRQHILLPAVAAILLVAGYVVWGMQGRIHRLSEHNAQLAFENLTHEQSAGRISSQITLLRETLSELVQRSAPDAGLNDSVDLLLQDTIAPEDRAGREPVDAASATLDRLQDVLGSIDGTLQGVRRNLAVRAAAADAVPFIWPADGWISASYGYRSDPFTGQREFHPAVDISTYKGAPVYATGNGRVVAASLASGGYGNLVEIDHGFGLLTRYGHLSEFSVAVGDTVLRGDTIGRVGNTGRATGHHVHYEVLMNGRTLNPRRLLIEPETVAAN